MEPEPGRLGVGEFAFPGPLRDQLVAAIIDGAKTTTTGLLADYELDAEPLPRPGDRQVVIDSAGIPVTLIEIVDVRVVRVGDIDLAHAVGEGEGYASVAEWRSGHERFWHSCEYREYRGDPAFTVNDDTLAVAQQFRVVVDDHQDLGSLLQCAWEADGDPAQLSAPSDRLATSSTPATGHDGATGIANARATATTSDNDSKITKCGWSTNRHVSRPVAYKPGDDLDANAIVRQLGYEAAPQLGSPLWSAVVVTADRRCLVDRRGIWPIWPNLDH